jgi:hypothetical protein
MLDCPELASGGIDRGTLYVAVALAPDCGLRVSLADEGVTIGGRAIGLQLHDLADMRVEILRQLACLRLVAFAQREVGVTGGAPLDVGPIVRGGRQAGTYLKMVETFSSLLRSAESLAIARLVRFLPPPRSSENEK